MNKFIEKLEIYSKYLLLLSTSSYILGIIVMNFYLAEYGIYDINPINVTYIIIGIVFLTYLVATFIIMYFLKNFCVMTLNILSRLVFIMKDKANINPLIINFVYLVVQLFGLVSSISIISYFKKFIFHDINIIDNFNVGFKVFILFTSLYIFLDFCIYLKKKVKFLDSFESIMLYIIKKFSKKEDLLEESLNNMGNEIVKSSIKKFISDDKYDGDVRETIRNIGFKNKNEFEPIYKIVNIVLDFKVINSCFLLIFILLFFKLTNEYSTKIFPSFNRYLNGNINQILFVKFKDNVKTDGQYIKVYESNEYYYFKEANSILKINKSDVELVEIL